MSKDIPAYRFEPGTLGKHPYLVLTFAFNEGEKLKRQLAKFPPPEERQYDLMLSDDGSTDGSTPSSYISEFGLRGITRLRKNMGLSPNIKAALDWYLTQSYEGVILMNGNDRDGVPQFSGSIIKNPQSRLLTLITLYTNIHVLMIADSCHAMLETFLRIFAAVGFLSVANNK